MATFRTNQRVKLVGAKINCGQTGVFLRYEFAPMGSLCPDGPLPFDCNCVVAYDNLGVCRDNTSRLVPATDCYDKSDWRECAWQPPHMRETA